MMKIEEEIMNKAMSDVENVGVFLDNGNTPSWTPKRIKKETFMDRTWLPAQELNMEFFDIFSMHSLPDLHAISEILKSFMPERIVEYGTAYGGLTKCLGRWAYLYDAKVLSIENHCYTNVAHPIIRKSMELLKQLPVELMDVNEYEQKAYSRIQDFFRGHKTLYYCDGGNKPLEFRWCARIIQDDDILVTHDYDMEFGGDVISSFTGIMLEMGHITKAQAKTVMDKYNLEPVEEFEKYLGKDKETGKRVSRIFAVRKRKDK